MRLSAIIVLCFFVLPLAASAQQSITKTMAGPAGEDQYRILVAFMGALNDSYRLQSFILDINRVKKNEEPSSFYLDLTTTDRNLATGEKKQKILVQRWKSPSDIEVKCEGGRWTKQSPGPEINEIIETVRSVIRIAPLDAKDAKEFDLPKAVAQKITDLLNGLRTSKLQCVREGSPD